jgi:DUF4097 and DUF4098 domain-containing protein YvlB
MLQTTDTITKTFQVGNQPRVIVQNHAGGIRVQRGNGNEVQVRATIHEDWTGSRPEVQMDCVDGNTVQITVQYEWSWKMFGHGGDVHFEILVPATVDLALSTHAGNIDVQNVYGQIELRSNAGSLTVSQSTLLGHAALQTNAGQVRFSGSIDPLAEYAFQTNAGSVELTVPANSALHVDASTNVGGIHTNFPLTIERHIPGGSIRGEVGPEPRAKIHMRSNAGSIALHSGQVE